MEVIILPKNLDTLNKLLYGSFHIETQDKIFKEEKYHSIAYQSSHLIWSNCMFMWLLLVKVTFGDLPQKNFKKKKKMNILFGLL